MRMSHYNHNKIQLPDWAYRIQRGDIIRKGNSFRIVRKVSPTWIDKEKTKLANSTAVYLSIRRCSWTNACYTLIYLRDIVKLDYQPTGMRAKLATEIDSQVDECINDVSRGLSCCDVEGIF